VTGGPDFAAVADALRDLPQVRLRELHCHPDVAALLREAIPEAGPELPGCAGHLTAIPVIEKPGLGPGCWEIRENGLVVQRCFRGPDGQLYVYTPPPLPPFTL
jgi:hypothetical protein